MCISQFTLLALQWDQYAEWVAARKQAQETVANIDYATLGEGKQDWLYFTIPERPVAGEDMVVFFNRAKSQPLV